MTSCLSAEQIQVLISPMVSRLQDVETESPIRKTVMEILNCAQSFVPCEAGSLMMSDPADPSALMFVASFGTGAEKLPGTVLPAGTGISGKVYASGVPFLTNTPSKDSRFYNRIDRLTEHETRSLLCVPLRAFDQSVGVLSLLNRVGGGFQQKDLDLLTIFCDHLAQSIQLMIEAKRQREAALIDHLSGLFNDRYLYQYLAMVIEDALKNDHDVGLIFLDLDHFKAVVDTHGHLVGSQALREIGILIGEVARSYDAMPARYGGDEYVVVVPLAEERPILDLAETLRKTIETAVLICEGEAGVTTPVTLQGGITASIGGVRLGQLDVEGRTVEGIRQHILRMADVAMYEAKARGKNLVHWHGN